MINAFKPSAKNLIHCLEVSEPVHLLMSPLSPKEPIRIPNLVAKAHFPSIEKNLP